MQFLQQQLDPKGRHPHPTRNVFKVEEDEHYFTVYLPKGSQKLEKLRLRLFLAHLQSIVSATNKHTFAREPLNKNKKTTKWEKFTKNVKKLQKFKEL